MPKIAITRVHGVTKDAAREKVRGIVDEVQQRYGKYVDKVEWTPDGCSAKAKGTGFTLSFVVGDRDVRIDGDLSFLLTPIKGKMESTVETKLDAAFGPR